MHIVDSSIWFYAFGAQHMFGILLLTYAFGAHTHLGLCIFYFWRAHTYCWLIYLVLRFWRTTHVGLIYILLLAYAFGAHILAYLYFAAVQAWSRSREHFSGLMKALPLRMTGQAALPTVHNEIMLLCLITASWPWRAKWLLHPNPWGRLTYPMNRPCTILLTAN